jgi:hypothetical protein
MSSEYGFIGEVKYEEDGAMFLESKSVTNIAWNDQTRAFYEDNIASGLRFYNMNSLFGKCMTAKQVVISNDPKNDLRACGIPKGHPPLDHFLGAFAIYLIQRSVRHCVNVVSQNPFSCTPLAGIPFFAHGCRNMVGMLAIAVRSHGQQP